MKSKHAGFEIEFDQRSVTPSKKIKNREHLRKKLKDLLEKDLENFNNFRQSTKVDISSQAAMHLDRIPEKKLKNFKESKSDTHTTIVKCSKKVISKSAGPKKNAKSIPSSILKRKSTENGFSSGSIRPVKAARLIKVINPIKMKSRSKTVMAASSTVLKTPKCSSKGKVMLQTKSETHKSVGSKFTKIPIKKIPPAPPRKQTKLTKQLTLASIEGPKLQMPQLRQPPKKMVVQREVPKPINETPTHTQTADSEANILKEPPESPKQIEQKKALTNAFNRIFASNDFEDDDDFQSYSCESSSDDDMVQCESESDSDPTYELPDHVPEDIYIASGKAIVHTYSDNHGVRFDSDTDSAQVVEITSATSLPISKLATKPDIAASPPKTKSVTKTKRASKKQALKSSWSTVHRSDDKPKSSLKQKSDASPLTPKKRVTLATSPKNKKHEYTNEFDDESDNSCPDLVGMDMQFETDSECYSDCLSSFSESDEPSSQPTQRPKMVPGVFKTDKDTIGDAEVNFFDVIPSKSDKDVVGSPLDRVGNGPGGNKGPCRVITTHNEVVRAEGARESTPKQKAAKKEATPPSTPRLKSSKVGVTAPPVTQKPKVLKSDSFSMREATPPSTPRMKGSKVDTSARNQATPPSTPRLKASKIDTSEKNQETSLGTPRLNVSLVDTTAKNEAPTPLAIPTPKESMADTSTKKEAPPGFEVAHIQTVAPVSLVHSNILQKDKFDIGVTVETLEGIVPPIERSFKSKFYNAINSNQVMVLLKDPIYIYGTVKLKLIAGALDIFGYNPKQKELLEVFSPRGYSSLKFEPTKRRPADVVFHEEDLMELAPWFLQVDLDEILHRYDHSKDAILVLERNDRSKKVNMLKKYMVDNLFPNMNIMQSDRPFYTSEFLLRCVITPKTDKALIVDPKWRGISINSESRLMVIGGKAVGKTTLLRYLVNANLNRFPKILLIDLDIGQPEIFIPQTISATTLTQPLLGPGYFSVKEPDKAFLVGQTNVILLPQRYIDNVRELLQYCHMNEEYRDIPWLVNTMGYNKGFGDELIVMICSFLNPTNVVQLESNRDINNFDVIMNRENIEFLECSILGDMVRSAELFRPQHNLTLMYSTIPNDRKYQKEWDMNPRDMRLAMIISRLSVILTGHSEWLTEVKPMCASTTDLRILNFGDDYATEEDLLHALGGNLVYLCQDRAGKSIECLGIGIVRGVDFPLKQIYLLPAVPLNSLEKVNCLALCGIPLPSSILINQGPKVKGLASYVYNTIDKVSSMYVNQIYHRPQHFLTGRYKSVVE